MTFDEPATEKESKLDVAKDNDESFSNGRPKTPAGSSGPNFIGLHSYNVRRMHTAVKLNEMMKARSIDAQLIFVNLPAPPKHGSDEYCKRTV